MRFDPRLKVLTISVGELVRASFPPVIRATPAPQSRLRAGVAGHQERRQAQEVLEDEERKGYIAEVPVRWRLDLKGWVVALEGRLDGIYRHGETWVIEEVKTVLLPEESFQEEGFRKAVLEGAQFPEYRFQLEVYLLIVWKKILSGDLSGLASESVAPPAEREPDSAKILGHLVFLNLSEVRPELREIEVQIPADLERIEETVTARIESLLEDLERRTDRLHAQELLSQNLPFPFRCYRPYQKDLETTVVEAFDRGEHLLLSAPAGIGKTAAALHGALSHALKKGHKVFWVTAKNTQQRIVVETVQRILEAGGETPRLAGGISRHLLRTLVLRAREKMCPNLREGGVVFCHDHYCRFARDYAGKVAGHGLMQALEHTPILLPEEIQEKAVAAETCPYELSLDNCLEADLIVGDYNYVFSPQSVFRRFSLDRMMSDCLLVVDEAHNLYARGREYFSSEVKLSALLYLRDWASAQAEAAGRQLHAWCERFLDIFRELEVESPADFDDSGAFPIELDHALLSTLGKELEEIRLRRLIENRPLGLSGPLVFDDPLESFSTGLNRFLASLELQEERVPIVTLCEWKEGQERLRTLCLDPSKPLSAVLDRFPAVLAMSATFEPLEFFRDVLGFPKDRTRTVVFPCPFPRENRKVIVDPGISTTFRRRSRHAGRIAQTIDAIASLRKGNYLVFFPSYRFMAEVAAHVDPRRLGEDVVLQPERMDEEERNRFLELLREPGAARIVFAVQGGLFAEGVDYPGSMAIGVIVVGPGLPKFAFEGELVRDHFDNLYQNGFEYAYLYPGMHRVIQSAGRVIRSQEDTGVIVLLGERFADSRYSRLFPSDWYENSPRELIARDLTEELKRFWEKHPAEGP